MKTELDLRDDAAELRATATVVREALEAGSAAPPTEQPAAAPLPRPTRARGAAESPEQDTFMAAVIAAVTHGLWLSR
jgi:hypothetical protein